MNDGMLAEKVKCVVISKSTFIPGFIFCYSTV